MIPAADDNISPRLIKHALKVLNDGCPELIGAVETDRVAVSTASLPAALPKEQQAHVVSGGDRAITARVRELRAGGSRREPASRPASPLTGRFGVVSVHPGAPDGVVFLWVAPGSLAEAIEALKARGLRYGPGESC